MPKAGVIYGQKDIRVEERPIATVDDRDVLIKVSACAVCGSDLHAYRIGDLYPPGTVFGHEFSGTVVEAGKDVQGLAKGSRVCVEPFNDLIGLFVDGGFAEYCLIKNAEVGRNIYLLPDSISDEAGALIEAFSVGLHGVNLANPKPDDRAVVLGAGPIGLCTLLGLKAAGVKDVVVTDMSEVRLKAAVEFGASGIFNVKEGKVVEFLKKHYGGTETEFQPHIVMDCAGVRQALIEAVDFISPRGKVVILAVYEDKVIFEPDQLKKKGIEITESIAYENEFKQAIALVSSGKANLEKMISHRYPLDRLSEAFQVQSDASISVKVMVTL